MDFYIKLRDLQPGEIVTGKTVQFPPETASRLWLLLQALHLPTPPGAFLGKVRLEVEFDCGTPIHEGGTE